MTALLLVAAALQVGPPEDPLLGCWELQVDAWESPEERREAGSFGLPAHVRLHAEDDPSGHGHRMTADGTPGRVVFPILLWSRDAETLTLTFSGDGTGIHAILEGGEGFYRGPVEVDRGAREPARFRSTLSLTRVDCRTAGEAGRSPPTLHR